VGFPENLQLDTIARCLELWSNLGDIVLTPFGGIGSEGYQAVLMGRKAVLVELKDAYFVQLVKNLQRIESAPDQLSLFEGAI